MGRGASPIRCTRVIATLAAAILIAVAGASAAQALTLSKRQAVHAARKAAARLARRQPGDAARPRFTRPACHRRSAHTFVCRTTVSGTTACDPGEAACDGPAPWALPYRITVRQRSTRSSRTRTKTRLA